MVSGDARVSLNQKVCFGHCKEDLQLNKALSILVQCNLQVDDAGYFIAYKHVKKNLSSLHDCNFKYEVGKTIKADKPEISDKSCASGLHVSHASYWNGKEGEIILFCLCHIKDVITVQEGKIRVKKLKVLSKSSRNVF